MVHYISDLLVAALFSAARPKTLILAHRQRSRGALPERRESREPEHQPDGGAGAARRHRAAGRRQRPGAFLSRARRATSDLSVSWCCHWRPSANPGTVIGDL